MTLFPHARDTPPVRSAARKTLSHAQNLCRQDGQDLVEYALVVALIAFAAVAGMKSMATKVNSAFSTIGTTISTNISVIL